MYKSYVVSFKDLRGRLIVLCYCYKKCAFNRAFKILNSGMYLSASVKIESYFDGKRIEKRCLTANDMGGK